VSHMQDQRKEFERGSVDPLKVHVQITIRASHLESRAGLQTFSNRHPVPEQGDSEDMPETKE